MLKIQKFVVNPFSENTYLIWDDLSKESAIIDPGTLEDYEFKELTDFISLVNLNLKFVINTHCHLDHIFGNKKFITKYNAKFFAPELDIPLLQNSHNQGKQFGITFDSSPLPHEFLTEELKLFLGAIEMKFLFSPGHTPGEYCIYFEKENKCVTGDVLFLESIGRTDLWGGDYNTLIQSIKTKLLVLPDETVIYPGHGDESTILHEKKYNPFLRCVLQV